MVVDIKRTAIQCITEKWGITPRTAQMLCSAGKIDGVTRFGKAWAIPINAVKPVDNRITSRKYRDWRKKAKDGIAPKRERIECNNSGELI